MQTKDALINIGRTRTVIQAQVRRLAELAPRVPALPTEQTIAGNAASLLAGVVNTDLMTAASALQGIAEAEADARKVPHEDKTASGPVIDVTPTEVT